MDSIADPQPDAMLDLTLTRNLEAFFRLLGMERVHIAAAIELNHGGHRTFVEVRNHRIMLTLAAPIDAWQRARALRSVASRWRPQRTAGVAVRGWLAAGHLCVSCTLPAASTADFWLRLYWVMLELLESSLRNEQ